MKKEILYNRLPILILVIFVFQGCMSHHNAIDVNKSRREAYINSYPNIDAKTKQAVLKGEIFIGMKKSAVVASYGEPYETHLIETASGVSEEWIYRFLNPIDASVHYSDIILYIENGILTEIKDVSAK